MGFVYKLLHGLVKCNLSEFITYTVPSNIHNTRGNYFNTCSFDNTFESLYH